jgi:short-subunit dehydrogenase
MPVRNKPNRDDEKHYALVTGSSQGLGRSLAEECARKGMNLILVALPETGLPIVAKYLSSKYDVEAVYRELDLTVAENAGALFSLVRDMGLPVSVLVNNAGVGYPGLFEDSQLKQNEKVIELNVTALVRLTHLFLPELKRHARSYILNVASLAAFYPMPYKPIYAPTKSFVLSFTLTLRSELSETPVRVSVLCPGGILSNRGVRRMIASQGFWGRISSLDPDAVARAAARGLFRGKGVIIPGWPNRLFLLLGKLVPRAVMQRVVCRRFRTAQQRMGGAPDGNWVPAAIRERSLPA